MSQRGFGACAVGLAPEGKRLNVPAERSPRKRLQVPPEKCRRKSQSVTMGAIVAALGVVGGREAEAGCTITWDGGAGTMSWHTAANWDTNVVPGPADDVCIPAG